MKKVHFIGIGGSGLSAVAGIAQSMGYEVSGCESIQEYKPNEYTVKLEKLGIKIYFEQNEEHLKNIDLVCVSAAVYDLPVKHWELIAAEKLGIPVMPWQEFVGTELQKDKKVVAIAGTKGKSTTTALIGLLLEAGQLDPVVEVGAKVANWGRNYRVGQGEYFVCEADEYNNNFLAFKPDMVILTNIVMDHPEFFASFDEYLNSFVKFVSGMKKNGVLIFNRDSEGIRDLLLRIKRDDIKILGYGKGENSDLQLINYEQVSNELMRFKVNYLGISEIYESNMVGVHNIYNCLATIELAKELHIPKGVCDVLFATFAGTGRRFELICEKNGVKVFNDYAHNPMSISSVLSGAGMKFSTARIWAVFQPHMYSRTKMFMDEFASSFDEADEIIITDIFASREKGKPIEKEVHSQMLVDRIKELRPQAKVRYVSDKEKIVETLLAELESGDVVVNMGAGDNGIIVEKLCEKLS